MNMNILLWIIDETSIKHGVHCSVTPWILYIYIVYNLDRIIEDTIPMSYYSIGLLFHGYWSKVLISYHY